MDLSETNRRVIEQFRAGGEVDGMHRDRLLLLTTTGRRTGQRRTTPMMFVRDGDRVVVLASNAGAPKAPDWYHNLLAEPCATVEIADETYDAVAVVTEGAQRERLWAMITNDYPFFAEHQAKAGREIPVVALERVS
ncbi:MAG TPA: nitroreductase family deazaflavin-dependent oxidoreductase [Streptosporangiaceae bacterium]